ncbi:hypothetical protein ACQW02_25375 [Humitalea sp. 24SJ18S-53]|uniref:hypothetical protein n=1 Tax=Humitalea sp. 24SJ18S-53 TaxID=3422307 RepID=UPI003D6767EB
MASPKALPIPDGAEGLSKFGLLQLIDRTYPLDAGEYEGLAKLSRAGVLAYAMQFAAVKDRRALADARWRELEEEVQDCRNLWLRAINNVTVHSILLDKACSPGGRAVLNAQALARASWAEEKACATYRKAVEVSDAFHEQYIIDHWLHS